ncbi:DUF732 domain-containing protein [Hoyosella altamirensis]|uniref:DUF732 domain-containing protein n=1 Tax=Hoyosella altamirensis TaxID=616997 RepID=A0A839RM28_9ACTN|nr:DUF732 domain-containing protein [Hoyosella altamirensis]MBB3037972.1 hypothetical protein [Hoyosella altamirensis]
MTLSRSGVRWRLPVLLAVLIATGGFTMACGNESVVSGTPDLGTSVTEAPSSDPEADDDEDDDGEDDDGDRDNERPESTAEADPDTSDPEYPPLDERGTRYVKELRDSGASPYGSGQQAVGTAEYVCAAVRDGVSREDMLVNVTAMVGLEMQLSGSDDTVDDVAQTYVEVAEQHYCGE